MADLQKPASWGHGNAAQWAHTFKTVIGTVLFAMSAAIKRARLTMRLALPSSRRTETHVLPSHMELSVIARASMGGSNRLERRSCDVSVQLQSSS